MDRPMFSIPMSGPAAKDLRSSFRHRRPRTARFTCEGTSPGFLKRAAFSRSGAMIPSAAGTTPVTAGQYRERQNSRTRQIDRRGRGFHPVSAKRDETELCRLRALTGNHRSILACRPQSHGINWRRWIRPRLCRTAEPGNDSAEINF